MAKSHTFKYLRSEGGKIVKKTVKRELTRNQAIKFQCLDCSGGYTAEVKKCQVTTCPLWIFRPYQEAD